jgi:hypothetical protein
MLPDRAIKRLQALPDISKQGKRINGLFRLMEVPELWLQAYANINANKGAMTPGVGSVTMDGFSAERAANLIELLKDGRYQPNPVRRTYVPKPNGKRRPLGMPSGDDKLVQEMVRLCRKFCSGDAEGIVAPVGGVIRRPGRRTVRPE